MHTREIKALIHRSRVVDVISALWSAGFRGVSLIDTFAHPLLLEAKQRNTAFPTNCCRSRLIAPQMLIPRRFPSPKRLTP